MSSTFLARPRPRGLAIAAIVVGAAFCTGWVASRKLTTEPRFRTLVRLTLTNPGDAPPVARARILDTMEIFQTAYTRRDLTALPGLMRRCFDPRLSVLAMGTEPLEWVTGYAQVSRFIAHDWTNWGTVHLDLDDAEISTAGPTAWLATLGTVTFGGKARPIRFTAVLNDEGDRWVFRQMQYQWNERPLQPLEVLPSPAKRWR